jgi:glycosyltransferase involved in cell wall biosynthesis
MFEDIHVAVVIPAYEAEQTARHVVETLPAWVRTVIVVDDGSRDATAAAVRQLAAGDPRVVLVAHGDNRGVGAAVRTGYRRALDAGAEIVVKMDSDGQMDPAYLPQVVFPVAVGLADYAKGSRFLRRDVLRTMPVDRLIGNAILSLVSKLSSGYWNVLDPTNGYTAISREALLALDLDAVDDRYFFESSMLIELGMVRAVVVDVPMPARYGDEQSHLSPARVAATFARRHAHHITRRFIHRHLLADFSPVSVMLAVALPALLFGSLFGAWAWLRSVRHGIPATAGTVMLAAFTTAFGLFGLVQAMIYDLLSVPQRPLTLPRMRPPPAQPVGR